MKINFRIIFTILFLFFFGIKLTYSNGTGTTENTNTETRNKISNYFLVDDLNTSFSLFQNFEKKFISFKNGTTLFDGIQYFFSDNYGIQYILDTNGNIRSLTESNFNKNKYYYNGRFPSLNYGNNIYVLETKDYIIIVKQNEIKYSVYENGKAQISIYSKKYRDFLTFNLDLLLYKDEKNFIQLRDNNRKRQLLNNISLKNDILIFAEPINIGVGDRGKGFIKYELNLNNIPEEYFNNFFEYRMVLHHSKTLNPNNYLDDVLLSKRDFDFQDYMLLGPDSFFPSFYKVDNRDILNSDDLIGTDGKSFFNVTRVFGINLNNYTDDNSGIGGTPFITLKNNGFAILKNNYILYNKDNSTLGYIYYNGSIYKNEDIGTYLDNVLSNFHSLKLNYLPKTKQYVISYVKNRFGRLTGHTIVVAEDKLYNLEGKQEYNGIYYVGSSKNNENVFITDNLLNKYYKDTEVNNNLTFYTLVNYQGKTHLVKSTDLYGRVSDQPVFDYILDGVNNNGFYVDPITGQNNNNVGSINQGGGYTDDNYTREKEREKGEELRKKEEIEKQYNIFENFFNGFKNFFGLFLITFPENYDNNIKIPFLKPIIHNGQAKIQYLTVNTELKPIEDKLNISLVGESPEYIKKGISMILGLLYLSCRIGIVFLSLIFLIYIYKYLNNILNLVFSSSFSSGTSNAVGLSAFVGFFTIFFSFCLSVFGHFTIFNPFFEIVINLLNLIFLFVNQNFFDFQTFYTFTNFLTVSLYGILGFYLVFRVVKTYGKIF